MNAFEYADRQRARLSELQQANGEFRILSRYSIDIRTEFVYESRLTRPEGPITPAERIELESLRRELFWLDGSQRRFLPNGREILRRRGSLILE